MHVLTCDLRDTLKSWYRESDDDALASPHPQHTLRDQ